MRRHRCRFTVIMLMMINAAAKTTLVVRTRHTCYGIVSQVPVHGLIRRLENSV